MNKVIIIIIIIIVIIIIIIIIVIIIIMSCTAELSSRDLDSFVLSPSHCTNSSFFQKGSS